VKRGDAPRSVVSAEEIWAHDIHARIIEADTIYAHDVKSDAER
jgi:hypothetical protein